MTLTIRERKRVQSSPREGLRQSWTEWQVVRDGRYVLSRHDFESQARAALLKYLENPQ